MALGGDGMALGDGDRPSISLCAALEIKPAPAPSLDILNKIFQEISNLGLRLPPLHHCNKCPRQEAHKGMGLLWLQVLEVSGHGFWTCGVAVDHGGSVGRSLSLHGHDNEENEEEGERAMVASFFWDGYAVDDE